MDGKLYKYSYKTARRALTSLTVYNTGLQRCEPENSWGPGVRDHYLIHHVVSGTGTLETGGVKRTVRAGQTFIIYPNVTVQYVADARDPWEYCWVGFQGADARYLVGMTDFSPEAPVIDLGDSARVRDMVMRVYNARGSADPCTVRMTGALYDLLAFFMERAKPAQDAAYDPGAEYVRRACDLIAGNFAGSISIEEVARDIGVSRSRLYRVFLTHRGMSPVEYLTHFRIRQACALLSGHTLPIKAVAYSVGYSDPLYFSRAFRRVTGVSPSDYANGKGGVTPLETKEADTHATD